MKDFKLWDDYLSNGIIVHGGLGGLRDLIKDYVDNADGADLIEMGVKIGLFEEVKRNGF